MNNGFQNLTDTNIDPMYYRQTAGTYINAPIDSKVKVNASAYYQLGKANPTTDLSAYEFSFEAIYRQNKVLYGLGVELLSGTDQNDSG